MFDFDILQAASQSTLTIHQIENGWCVVVHRKNSSGNLEDLGKAFQAIATVIPEINKAGGAAVVQGVDEEADSWKKKSEERQENKEKVSDDLQSRISKAFQQKQKKPFEIFFFFDRQALMSFLDAHIERLPKRFEEPAAILTHLPGGDVAVELTGSAPQQSEKSAVVPMEPAPWQPATDQQRVRHFLKIASYEMLADSDPILIAKKIREAWGLLPGAIRDVASGYASLLGEAAWGDSFYDKMILAFTAVDSSETHKLAFTIGDRPERKRWILKLFKELAMFEFNLRHKKP